MSNYNSTNTWILATHDQNGNKRMLLAHKCDSGRIEYVIGSYFTEKHYDGALGYEHWDYSWDWGHYFQSIVAATDYWKREVLWQEAELFVVHDKAEHGSLDGYTLQVMFTNNGWSAQMYDKDGTPTTYDVSAIDSKEEVIRRFENHHRPTCTLESVGRFER